MSAISVLRSAECDTDHKLVRVRRKIRLVGATMPKLINVTRLSQSAALRRL